MPNEQRTAREQSLMSAMRVLQHKLATVGPALPNKASDLFDALRRELQQALRAEVLLTPQYSISELFRMTAATAERDGTGFRRVLAGGPKEQSRQTTTPSERERLVRADGAVIHFALTVKEWNSGAPLTLLGYNFELYFPTQNPINFLRFDLGFENEDNDLRGFRSHLHPGHDDIQVPSAVISPVDALGFLLYQCRARKEY